MENNKITAAEKPLTKAKDEIIKEARRIEEDTLYSSKGHFAASHFWSNFHLWVGIPIVFLSALAGTSALSEVSHKNLIAGILAIIVAVLSGVWTFINPNEKASAHLNSGNNYDALQNKIRIFRTIECWDEESNKVLTEKLKTLTDQKDKLNLSCPQIPHWAYKAGKKGIEAGEADYRVDKN